MSDFPTIVTTNGDPTNANTLANAPHAEQHQSHNAEIKAVQTKVGTGASTPTANTLMFGTGTGTSAWTAVTSTQLRATISDETGTGSAVFATSPTITTPAISNPTVTAGGTFASPVLTTPQIITSINDSNGNEIIKTPATGSATNEITVTNAVNGSAPKISATGSSDTNVNLNLQGKGTGSVQINGTDILAPFFDHIVSGCIWSGDSYGASLNASMTSGVVYIGGNFLTVVTVIAHAFTASKDTYVDYRDNGDGTASIQYNAVTNNTASQALTAGDMRGPIIVTGAGSIAAVGSVNQGEETKVLPIASSLPYAVTDSLGNLICPRDPNRKLLGLRPVPATGSTTNLVATQLTGAVCPVNVPNGRKVKVTLQMNAPYNSTDQRGYILETWRGVVTSGTLVLNSGVTIEKNTPSAAKSLTSIGIDTPPGGGAITYNGSFYAVTSGTAVANAVGLIMVELY